MPTIGSRARITYFGGGHESAQIVAVQDDGRRLQVRGEAGEMLEFVLSPSTAKFVRPGQAIAGERLELLN
ncbi:MAG TPA: hypothetical protein VIC05_09525 [Solirubrobacteraceae bacterium]|jgi:hypothetical protein